jgi:hypothetical protein
VPAMRHLTLLFAHFIMSNEVTADLRSAVNQRDITNERTWPGAPYGHFVSPSWQKFERVEAHRQRLRQSATQWVRRYFPGTFASLDVGPPTLDLLTTDLADPFGLALLSDTDIDKLPADLADEARMSRPLEK